MTQLSFDRTSVENDGRGVVSAAAAARRRNDRSHLSHRPD